MNSRLRTAVLGCLALIVCAVRAAAQETRPSPLTRAEVTDFEETTLFDGVLAFLRELESRGAPWRRETFGPTVEGRALPLLVLEAPRRSPDGAPRIRPPRVLLLANIHAGEVEGKEALLVLLREFAEGRHAGLRAAMDILVAPVFNADGNERIAPGNRAAQNGPVRGVGIRANAAGLDLNRDFMKLESPEVRSLVADVLRARDPDLLMDLHTTNGSPHGFALTYARPLLDGTGAAQGRFLRGTLLPEAARVMAGAGFPTWYYGNFRDERDPGKGWETFENLPRYGTNYMGLRNRLAVLSEAYAYRPFGERIAATRAFVLAVLESVARHAGEIVALVEAADRDASTQPPPGTPARRQPLAFRLARDPDPAEILLAPVMDITDPGTGLTRHAAGPCSGSVRIPHYGSHEPVADVGIPAFWILDARAGDGALLLLRHGLTVLRTTGPAEIDVESFRVMETALASRPFQGHRIRTLEVAPFRQRMTFPAGTFIVPSSQRLRALAVWLLDPRSPDGILAWNILDPLLAGAAAEILPVHEAGELPPVRHVIHSR